MTNPRDLLKSLLGYIEEQLNDIDPRGYRLSQIKDLKIVPAEIRNLPGVEFDIKTEGDHTWLKIDRLTNCSPPEVSDKFRELVTVSQDPNGHEPSINQSGVARKVASLIGGNPSEQDRIEAEQELTAKTQEYLRSYDEAWKRWAANEIPRRKTINLYAELFSLTRALSSSEVSNPSELVCGIGCSAWTMSYEGASFDFQYPLLTQSLEMTMNAKSMALELRPRAVDARVELDAFVACSIAGASEVEKTAKEHLKEHLKKQNATISPFDTSTFRDVLKLIAQSVDSQGHLVERADDESFPMASEHLVVSETWLIFARPRNNNYLVEDLRRLQTTINDGCSIPDGPLSFVTPPSDEVIEYHAVNFRGISSRGDGGSPTEELYFPLPYNQEQVTIVQRLQRANGVTVQGPPGTGKTHTIANIICHYLALGKRILVTSRGEQALKVLQSKIPSLF